MVEEKTVLHEDKIETITQAINCIYDLP